MENPSNTKVSPETSQLRSFRERLHKKPNLISNFSVKARTWAISIY